MDQLFNDLQYIFTGYGWVVAVIALAGIIILGGLKYGGAFKKVDKQYRHYIYLAISVGLSLIATIVYFACIHYLTKDHVAALFTVFGSIFTLNQTAYVVYANTPLKSLFLKLLDLIKGCVKKSDKLDEDKKEIVDNVIDKVKDVVEEKVADDLAEDKKD